MRRSHARSTPSASERAGLAILDDVLGADALARAACELSGLAPACGVALFPRGAAVIAPGSGSFHADRESLLIAHDLLAVRGLEVCAASLADHGHEIAPAAARVARAGEEPSGYAATLRGTLDARLLAWGGVRPTPKSALLTAAFFLRLLLNGEGRCADLTPGPIDAARHGITPDAEQARAFGRFHLWLRSQSSAITRAYPAICRALRPLLDVYGVRIVPVVVERSESGGAGEDAGA